MKRALLPALLLLASCSKAGPADIRISEARARATVPGQTATAAYLTLRNDGVGDDKLVGVSAAAPAKATLHSSFYNRGGAVMMRQLQSGLAVPAGTTIKLEPGGTHVMITGLRAPLNPGDSLKLTFRFEKSGERPVDVEITSAVETGSH